MKLTFHKAFGFFVITSSILAAEGSSSAQPVSGAVPGAVGMTRSELEHSEPKDPEWEEYVQQRARLRALIAERTQAMESAAPAERSKVGQLWDKKHAADFEAYEKASKAIAKRSAAPVKSETNPRKEQRDKPSVGGDAKLVDAPIVGEPSHDKDKSKDSTKHSAQTP